MILQDEICEALCSTLRVREIGIGYSISTSFTWLTGDSLTFFARTKGNCVRFEDDGLTVSELEGAGVDLESASRLDLLATLLQEHDVIYDQAESLFHTEWMQRESFAAQSAPFLAFMLRVQDLVFTTRQRVASTFKDDLIAALEKRFGVHNIETQATPVAELSYYVVDITVRSMGGPLAAIFPGTSEQKALEAVLFAKEIELKKIDNIVPFLVFEDAQSSKISRATQSKAFNSDLQIGAWHGAERDFIDKVQRCVS